MQVINKMYDLACEPKKKEAKEFEVGSKRKASLDTLRHH